MVSVDIKHHVYFYDNYVFFPNMSYQASEDTKTQEQQRYVYMHVFTYYVVIWYAVERQISMLFIDNKNYVFCIAVSN